MSVPTLQGTIATTAALTAGTGLESFTINMPTGKVIDEVVVVVIRSQTNISTTTGTQNLGGVPPVIVGPLNNSAWRANWVFVIPITAANVGSATLTAQLKVTTTGQRLVAVAARFADVDVTSPVVATDGATNAETTGSSRSSIPFTSAAGHTTLFFGFSEFSASNTHVPTVTPAGYTLVGAAACDPTPAIVTATTASRTYVWMGQKGSVASEPAATITWGTPVASWASALTLRGRAAPVPTGMPVMLENGTFGTLSVYDDAGASEIPNRIEIIRQGFVSVAEMGATPGAVWAHRGGSANWPEMSEYAYDQCLMRDCGVLEFSTWRTSDGVWIGSHDSTLARTAQDGALTTSINSMTWAQVQTHLNTLNSGGVGRPYYKLTDFLAKYHNHAILMVDNKSQAQNVSEYLPMLLTVPDAVNKIIVKLDGVNVIARYQEAVSAGFKVAGYWYANNYVANLPTRAPYTDFIGMEIGATQSIWDSLKTTYNKPLWGHVATDQVMYDQAVAKGARSVQTGQIASITPVNRWTTQVVPPTLANTTIPTISGTTVVGSTVTVTNGGWASTPDSYTYQWKRNGTAIVGETTASHILVTADIGTNAITCTVTAAKAGFTAGQATSASISPTAVPSTPDPLVIVGSAAQGAGSTSSTTRTLTMPAGISAGDTILITAATASQSAALVPSGIGTGTISQVSARIVSGHQGWLWKKSAEGTESGQTLTVTNSTGTSLFFSISVVVVKSTGGNLEVTAIYGGGSGGTSASTPYLATSSASYELGFAMVSTSDTLVALDFTVPVGATQITKAIPATNPAGRAGLVAFYPSLALRNSGASLGEDALSWTASGGHTEMTVALGFGLPASNGLFFDASPIQQPGAFTHKSYPHWWTFTIRSWANETPESTDWYSDNMNNPESTDSGFSTSRKYGGHSRSRPMYRPPLPGATAVWNKADRLFDIDTAIDYGHDGFFCDILSAWKTRIDDLKSALATARASNPGRYGSFNLIPMIDAGSAGAVGPTDVAGDYLLTFKNYSRSVNISGVNYMLWAVYDTDNEPISTWQALSDHMTNHPTNPTPNKFIGTWNSSYTSTSTGPGAAAYVGLAYGEGPWVAGQADPTNTDANVTTINSYSSAAHGRGRIFIHPIRASETRPTEPPAGYGPWYAESWGTLALERQWAMVLQDANTDWVQPITWSDWTEDTAFAPGTHYGYSKLMINAWFMFRWKTGAYPTILQDAVVLSHRQHRMDLAQSAYTYTGTPTSTTQIALPLVGTGVNYTPTKNEVEALVFLKSPATVRIIDASGTTEFGTGDTVAAGMTRHTKNLVAGVAPKVEIWRGGIKVTEVLSKRAVTATPYRRDWTYWQFTNLHDATYQTRIPGPASQYP